MDRRGGRDRGDRHREERRLAARRAEGGIHQCSRSRRRLGLGRGSVRREPLAHRARSAGRQAPHPARDVGERGRVRRRRRVGDERDRRRGLPHRPAYERGARRRADGVAARRRCRRRCGVGRRGEPAVARRRAPVPRLRRGVPRRHGRAPVPDRLGSPPPGRVAPITQAIVDGMRHFLEQRGFEAGGYTVGFQSCDASTAQAGGSDFFRCGSNAKAYARNLSVVGVVGSFQSRPARTSRSP